MRTSFVFYPKCSVKRFRIWHSHGIGGGPYFLEVITGHQLLLFLDSLVGERTVLACTTRGSYHLPTTNLFALEFAQPVRCYYTSTFLINNLCSAFLFAGESNGNGSTTGTTGTTGTTCTTLCVRQGFPGSHMLGPKARGTSE